MFSLSSGPLVDEVVQAAERLPPFPDVVWKVMPLIQKMAPVNEIEAVIKYDQVITAKVLALSQSPYFARRRTITTLHDAVVTLGDQQLIAIVLAACASRYFTGEATGYDLTEGELWEHAVATALMCEMVGRRLGRTDILTAYTSALLHDIGKTVLNFYVETYFDDILALVKTKKVRFIDAEREVLGVDHQQLGAVIARRWRFPAEVVMAIGCHHHPSSAKSCRDLVALVYVANRMVSALGIGCGVDGFLQPNQDEVFVELGVTGRMVESSLADFLDIFKETKQFFAA